MKLKIAVLASILLFVPLAVSATPPVPLMPGSFEISAGGGVVMPMGDFNTFAEPGFGFGGHGSFYVMPNLAIGGSVVYNSLGTDKAYEALAGQDISQSIWEFTANGKYMFMPGPVSPYAKASAGIFRYKAESGGVSGSTNDFGVGGGLGAQMRLPASNIGFFAEGMIYNVFTDGSSTNYFGVRGGVNLYISPTP